MATPLCGLCEYCDRRAFATDPNATTKCTLYNKKVGGMEIGCREFVHWLLKLR